MIYLNGEPKEAAVQCFGSNINELMENAKQKLSLMQPIQALFDENGRIVSLIVKIQQDYIFCID
jgi:hypothetical protein